MWTGIALIAFVVATAFDYKWLKTFAWPLYLAPARAARRDPGDRARRRRRVALDLDRAVRLPVQRAGEDPDDRRPRELPRRPPGPAPLAAVDPRRLRPRRAAVDPRHAPARPRHVARPRSRSSAGMLFMSGAQPALARRRWPARSLAALPLIWTYVLRDYQKQRLIVRSSNPSTDTAGRRLPARTSRRSRSVPAG